MKRYTVQGQFKAGIKWEKFTKSLPSQNEKTAVERVYSLIGSEHGLKRNFIRINSVKEE